MSVSEVIVIAAFRRADLVRLHVLLATYESPFNIGEAERREDEQAHRELRREIERLLSADVLALDADSCRL